MCRRAFAAHGLWTARESADRRVTVRRNRGRNSAKRGGRRDSRLDGRALEESPLTQFVFDGVEVTFSESGRRVTSKYVPHPGEEPKQIVLTGMGRDLWTGHTRAFGHERDVVNGVYSVEGDRLVICMDPRQGAPAPPELQTTEGDGRLWIELRRMTDVETAAIARNALSPKRLVDRLDTDGDGFLTYREYAYRSEDAAFWNADRDGDDRLSPAEFQASRPGEPAETARAAFQAIDQNGDGQIRLGEFQKRPPADEPSAQGGPVTMPGAVVVRRVVPQISACQHPRGKDARKGTQEPLSSSSALAKSACAFSSSPIWSYTYPRDR